MKGVAAWLFQRVSGAVLLLGLIIHFLLMHYSGHEQIRHEIVLKRLSSPYWKAFDLIFLVSVTYHGFNGMWGIALEYINSARLLKLSQILFVAAATLLIIAGVYIVTL